MDRDIKLSHVNSEVKKKNWRDRNEGKELKKKKAKKKSAFMFQEAEKRKY